jgi:phosphoribosylformimino-5-aminoimidazole carboxamide ribotide isomerase
MIAIPAVEVRDGACVIATPGAYVAERARLGDPVAVARAWQQLGFRRLHLVDVDAALGTGSNLAVVEAILRDRDVDVQVGGGIRSTESVDHLFQAGAEGVVVGTRAIEDPQWLGDVAAMYPGVVVVATDVRDRRVVTRGWVRTLPVDILDLVEDLNSLPLGAVLVTAAHLEGQMTAPDLALLEDVAEKARFPVIASGSVATMNDIRALEHRGVSAVVIGAPLYTGALDPRGVAQEFGE